MGVAPSSVQCGLLTADQPVLQAELRAKKLGFRPNHELAHLPFNRLAALDGLSKDEPAEGTQLSSGGKVTPGTLAWLKNYAAECAAASPPSAADIASMGLLKTQARYRLKSGLRLASGGPANDVLITALELHPPPDGGPFPANRLGTSLIACTQQAPSVICNREPSAYFSGCDEDRLMALGVLLGYSPVDRTYTWSNGLRMRVLDPIPPLDPCFDSSLAEVFAQRCNELLAAHPRLHLLWSGGIDSTSMLVAFLRTASQEHWRKSLSVHYCARSMQENPGFYRRFVASLPQHGLIEGHLRDFIDGTRVVVLGDPADMLFGTIAMAQAFASRRVRVRPKVRVCEFKEAEVENPIYYGLERPWRVLVPRLLRVHGLLAPGASAERAWLRWMEPQVAKAPIAVETLFDWFWWITYSCKFQFDVTRLFYNRSEVTQQLIDSVVFFYHTPAWHQWSFHNHGAKMQDKAVWASYKQPLKQWIYDFDGDAEYYAGKVKGQSESSPWGYQMAIDDRLNIIHFGWLSVSRWAMQEKYGDSLERFVERSEAPLTTAEADVSLRATE